ncbi:MAG: alpha/beta hydrolase [Betaproteobacteria bacterium]
MSQVLDAIEIETGPGPDATVIWLHGLGADGHDFEPIVPELRLPKSLRIRFVFPNAPLRAVTINGGMRMPAWYDILQLGGGAEDEAGIRASQAQVEQLMAREQARGVPLPRIVLAGFSQGGAVVLHTGLRQPAPIAGIMALSTYLPLAGKLAAERSAASAGVPVFMAHGRHDPMIQIGRALASREALEKLGYKVDWREYAMPHSVCAEEITDMAAFLVRIL